METNELKILLGNSIEELEVDMDLKEEFTDYPYQESAMQDYYFSILLNSIGKNDFQENYSLVKNKIKSYSTKDQLRISAMILKQIEIIYEFVLPKYLHPDNQIDINNLFEFLEFIEFDHEDFIKEIWYYLDTEETINIDKICKKQSDKIILEIEEQLGAQYFSEITSYFLRTYNKENIISWFCDKSKKLKTLILLTILKEK